MPYHKQKCSFLAALCCVPHSNINSSTAHINAYRVKSLCRANAFLLADCQSLNCCVFLLRLARAANVVHTQSRKGLHAFNVVLHVNLLYFILRAKKCCAGEARKNKISMYNRSDTQYRRDLTAHCRQLCIFCPGAHCM